MKLSLYTITGIVFFLSISASFSQESIDAGQEAIENIIEEIANNTDEELDYTSLFDDLYFYYNNPLNLNSTNEEELEKLQFLNDFQIRSILNYIEENGNFLSVFELQLIYGFTPEIISYLLPFIQVSSLEEKEEFSLKRSIKYGRNEIFTRCQTILEERAGYSPITDSLLEINPNSRYAGNATKLYVKYKFTYKDKIAWGLTMEKDPGEQFFRGEQKYGFDYYSGFIQIQDISRIKAMVLGDYQLKFGQGLTVWSGLGGRKSSYVLNIKKKGQGLSKYSSTDENKFFRGIATTLNYKNVDFTLFLSHKPVDANIDSLDANDEVYSFTSRQSSGFHTTPNEIFDKDALSETIFGGNILYTKNRFKAGLSYFNYSLDAYSSKEISVYNQNEKYLANYTNLGVHYQYYYKNIDFFGEIASNENFKIATVNGLLLNLTNQFYLSVLHRYFQNEYYSYYGSAFGENSKIVNEQGLYYGAEIYPYRNWKLSLYFDNYKFPFLKSSANSPSDGIDYFIQADFNPTRYLSMYVRYKNETKQVNENIEEVAIPSLVNQKSQKLRYHLSYRISDEIKLKNRIEFAKVKEENSAASIGYILYQDVNYAFQKYPANVSFRFAVFDTDSYDSRIYAYENDVLYAFSVPAYYYKGTRSYLTIKYTVFRGLDLWFRIAQTYFSNRDHHGSGLTEIDGPAKTEVKVQLRYKF